MPLETDKQILELRQELEKTKAELETAKTTINVLKPFIEYIETIGRKYREQGMTTEQIVDSYASYRGRQIRQEYEKHNRKGPKETSPFFSFKQRIATSIAW